MEYRCVSQIAFRDISEYLVELHGNYNRWGSDNWVVSPNYLNTKKQRYLNKLLGLSGVNHLGNTNWINNPHFKGYEKNKNFRQVLKRSII